MGDMAASATSATPPAPALRPRVTICYAQSLDGSIAGAERTPLALSGPESLTLTHQLRASHDAILVGIGTLLTDNPQLTVRHVPGPHPRPIVADSRLRCPPDARILQDPPRSPLIATTAHADADRQSILEAAGARVLRLPCTAERRVDLAALLASLAEQGIQRLMVEGGGEIISSFLAGRLVDSIVITIAPRLIGGLPVLAAPVPVAGRLVNVVYDRLGDDLIVTADLAWDPE